MNVLLSKALGIAMPFMFFFGGSLQAQQYSQALVYFKSGVTRNLTPGDTSATITGADITAVLTEYGLTSANVYPAFPTFIEADTLVISGTDSIRQMDKAKVFAITTPDTTVNNSLIASLQALPEVVYAEVNGADTLDLVPNDPGFTMQWGLNNTTNAGDDIHAENAWNITTGNANSIIAVIDHGVDRSQPDLSAKIAGGDNTYSIVNLTVPISHGTLIAGIAAASTNNSTGIAGVDWQAKIIPEDWTDYHDCFCLAYLFSQHGDNLISQKIYNALNYSPNVWTFNHSYDLPYSNGTPGRYSITLRQAFADIYKNNRLSVVSNGDYGSNYPNSYVYPAAFPTGLLAVGSSETNDQPSFYSYNGNLAFTSVIAPGDGIYSTNYNNTYTVGSGTSFAAPFVAGIASLLKGYNTTLYNDDIIHIIEMSTNSQGNLAPTAYTNSAGYGRVNAQQALEYLQAPYTFEHLTTTGGAVYATSPTQQMIMLGVNRLSDAGYIVQRIQVRKTITLPTNFCSITGVWGTGMGSTGLRDDGGYCYGEPYCEVVPGTLTSTQATLATYVYHVTDILGDNLGYYPEVPQNATFGYTVIGIPEPTIAGDNAFCNTSDPYTVTNLTTAPGVTASIAWSASPSIVTVNTPSASQTTLTSNSGGTFTLNAAITNGCGLNHAITISKPNIAVNNPPAPSISITGIEPLQAGTEMDVTVSTIERPPYLWYVNGTLVATEYTTSATINGGSNCNVLNTLKVTVANSCGTTSATTQYTRPCTGSNFVLSPNPSSGIVTVSAAPLSKVQSDLATGSSAQPGNFYEIKVIDHLGNIRKVFTYPLGSTSEQLDLSSLSNGTYFIQINNKETLSVQQVVILK